MKIKVIKRIGLLLIGLMLISIFSACGGGDASDGSSANVSTDLSEVSTDGGEDTSSEPSGQLTFVPASPDGQVLTEKGHSPQIIIRNYNETATDALGRVLPTSEETGMPKEGKYVGLFYSYVTAGHNCDNDNSKSLAVNPYNPDFGPRWEICFWAEPETGYHRGDDVWQIRRDMYYFAMAGVDFLYVDLTNGLLYEGATKVFLDTCVQMRAEGQMTPYIVPWCFGTATENGGDIGSFYNQFMTVEKYKDLWFHWEGKPLALIKPQDDGTYPILNDARFSDKLTFRKAWTMPNPQRGEGYWLDNNVVNFGYGYGYRDSKSVRFAECIGIGCAGFANFGTGRSGRLSTESYLNDFLETDTQGLGLVFEDAFKQVMRKNPECQVLLISRWNEWVAQNFTHPDDKGTDTGFVDQFNAEFSRDIEPMKGGFTDNYFYQMCSIIRRFKGVMPADEVSGENTIYEADPDVFEKWQNVSPVYTDFRGDTTHRDHPGALGNTRYVNTTGRNDIVESRITADGGNLYVYVRTAENMTSYKDKNWMMLFIDADSDKNTGWEGYDYLVNYEVVSDTVTTLCAYKDGVWQEIGTVAYLANGDRMTVTIPRSLIGLTDKTLNVNFHWMDNVSDIYDLESWFTTGDSAPERRNNYSYKQDIDFTGENERFLPARESGAISGMRPVTFTDEEQNSLEEGLKVSFYPLVENYPSQPDFRLIDVLMTGSKSTKTITAEDFVYSSNVGMLFEGYIYVEQNGAYEFELSYDDGAKLFIDGRLVVDGTYDPNAADGIKTAKGSIILEAGYHAIRVEYAELKGGNAYLSLEGDWKFFRVVDYKKTVEAGLILREDFDNTTFDELEKHFDIEATFTLENGWLCGNWIDGRRFHYVASDLKYYTFETRIIAGGIVARPYRSAIALRIPTDQPISKTSLYVPDNNDSDPTSYLGTSGIFLYCAENTLEVAIHIKDETRFRKAHSVGYTFTLPEGVSFGKGAVIRFEDKGETIDIYCEGDLLATVRLSKKGRADAQYWKGESYRYAEVLDANGKVVLTTEGYEAYVPASGNCAVVERANFFKLDYIELYQLGYTYNGDEIVLTD